MSGSGSGAGKNAEGGDKPSTDDRDRAHEAPKKEGVDPSNHAERSRGDKPSKDDNAEPKDRKGADPPKPKPYDESNRGERTGQGPHDPPPKSHPPGTGLSSGTGGSRAQDMPGMKKKDLELDARERLKKLNEAAAARQAEERRLMTRL